MIKLYEVNSMIPNYANTGISVPVLWVYEREKPLEIDYSEVIQDYELFRSIDRLEEDLRADRGDYSGRGVEDSSPSPAEIAINELFTLEEAQTLQQHLQESHGLESVIKEAELPIPQTIMPTGLIPAGGDYEYLLSEEVGAPLPGEVWGLIDRSAARARWPALGVVSTLRKALQAGLRPDMSDEELLEIALKITEEKPEEE